MSKKNRYNARIEENKVPEQKIKVHRNCSNTEVKVKDTDKSYQVMSIIRR